MPVPPPYPGPYIEEIPSGSRTITGVATSITAFIGRAPRGSVDKAETVTSFAEFERQYGGLSAGYPLTYAVRDFFQNGGSRAVIVRLFSPADGTGADSKPLDKIDYIGDANLKTGMNALATVDLFNLLCIPPDTQNGDTLPAVYQSAMQFCAERRAMLIVDSPAAWSADRETAAAKAAAGLTDLGLTGVAARNAALYFPRVREADPMRGGMVETFVPCGIVAGVMARTDAQRGVWKAPAGLHATFGGTSGLDAPLNDQENALLSPLGINLLRSFPGSGNVVWGARTLRGADQLADEYKYVPVRRLALFIEESLLRGTKWVVFEPNDEPLWAQIRLNVGAFMHNLFRQGAFQGTTPRDAYFVKCDGETTIQNDIDLGTVNILVGFAPLKPAEFVIIKLQIAGSPLTR